MPGHDTSHVELGRETTWFHWCDHTHKHCLNNVEHAVGIVDNSDRGGTLYGKMSLNVSNKCQTFVLTHSFQFKDSQKIVNDIHMY